MADLKATRCGELPKTEFSPQTEQLISLLERRGIVEDHSIVNEKARQAEQALRRNMYHNTQMMLKHYRDIVWALECFPEQVAEEKRSYTGIYIKKMLDKERKGNG